MSSRDNILGRLRAVPRPFDDHAAPAERHVMAPMEGVDLVAEFVAQARALSANVLQPETTADALDALVEIIGGRGPVSHWAATRIPLPGVLEHLTDAGLSLTAPGDGSAAVGITGVEAALAATGSIVVGASAETPRGPSLLPYTHIAVLTEDQILPHFDAWIAAQTPEAFRAVGTINVITGASRTADIAQQLILGAHGPAELHLILLPG